MLTHVPAAQAYADNDAMLYLIDGHLSNYRGNTNTVKLWVWGVKASISTYTGIICHSGIIPDGQTEISSGVFISFHEDDILLDETDALNRREISSGVVIRLDTAGKFYLKEEVIIPDNVTAELELKKRNPKLKGGAILLRIGEPKKQKTFWAIMGANGYEGISPFTGETDLLSRNVPIKAVLLGEPAGKGYYLTLQKKIKKICIKHKKGYPRVAFLLFKSRFYLRCSNSLFSLKKTKTPTGMLKA